LVKADDIMDFIEEWQENVALYDGNNGCSLAHIIHDEVVVIAEADDPDFGRADSVYGSMRDEIIVQVNHASPQYHADNAKVLSYYPMQSVITSI
jgi:hypothetical protein